ncbi:MAG: glycosyltransferase [Chitinivibrionales bacterium]|nr:glycosyltransferase [Chitinivibrionales bacterium]
MKNGTVNTHMPRGRSAAQARSPLAPRRIRLAYVHDMDGWAIHNVGLLWLGDPGDSVEVTYLCKPALPELHGYDLVWFGHYRLWKQLYRGYGNTKSIISVHDPSELPVVKLRRSWGATIVTASVEMQNLLAKRGVKAYVIPTTTDIELRDPDSITGMPPKLLAISSTYPRKNTEKVARLFQRCGDELGLVCTTKFGHNILSREQYVSLLDTHSIFVCLSSQEGGPLPAMEAMARGCIVLSTRVGQMPELLDGDNGFILGHDEFFEKVAWIRERPDWLLAARRKAIATMAEKRDVADIQRHARELVARIARQSRWLRLLCG